MMVQGPKLKSGCNFEKEWGNLGLVEVSLEFGFCQLC